MRWSLFPQTMAMQLCVRAKSSEPRRRTTLRWTVRQALRVPGYCHQRLEIQADKLYPFHLLTFLSYEWLLEIKSMEDS